MRLDEERWMDGEGKEKGGGVKYLLSIITEVVF